MPESFVCGSHRAFVYERGGVNVVGELEPLSAVHWQRIRDDISTAYITVPTAACCELLADVRSAIHELHLVRDGDTVWQGAVTRVEYEHEQTQLFAEDLLFQAKRKVLEYGYDMSYPNIGSVVDRMHWLMNDMCYSLDGNRWNVSLNPHHNLGEPTSSRQVFAYQFTVWEDFDKYAEDNGTDYTVVNREIHYWDNHFAWKIIPPLDQQFLSQFPRVVEYGNQVATRMFVTNGRGQAGISQWPPDPAYGRIEQLITRQQDGTDVATPEEIADWQASADHNIVQPAPLNVVIPANTTLMPGAPWTMDDLWPGAWFQISVTDVCRPVTAWQRLHEIVVSEEAPAGELVQFTAVDPPIQMIVPVP